MGKSKPPLRGSTPVVCLFALLAAPGMVVAQGGMPMGPEFRVNTGIVGNQQAPSAAFDSAGNFVVAWESSYAGYDIFAQRYSSSGAPLGPEFRVNTFVALPQRFPAMASDPAGNFVVVWQDSGGQDGHQDGIFAQRYANTGAPLGGEFRVNTYTTSVQRFPAVASDSAGNFVVAWLSDGADGYGYGVFAQRYANTGAPLGTEFRVNTYTTFHQFAPSVASDSAGNFIVVWEGIGQDGGPGFSGAFGQRYSGTGVPLGGEFRVNTYTTNDQRFPNVSSDSAGNFVVTWWSRTQDGSGSGVYAQRYSSAGAPLGGEFLVNSYTTGNQFWDVTSTPVVSDSTGNFVVTWASPQDGAGNGIFGQRYSNTGAPLGGEFRINTFTTSDQYGPAVASNPAGNFVVMWQSNTQDGNGFGVYAQRYSPILPVELQGFQVE